jgi:GTP cyclohydrolase II
VSHPLPTARALHVTDSEAVNGDPRLVAIDRALTELRRGRAIAITDTTANLLAAALETADNVLIQGLRDRSPQGLALAMPAERARALGLASGGDQPVLLRLDPALPAAAIAALGQRWQAEHWRDVLGNAAVVTRPGSRLCDAALRLAKRAQLLPAVLIAVPASPVRPDDVLQLSLADIERSDSPEVADLLRVSEARVPLRDCEDSRLVLFRDLRDGAEHIAVLVGRPDLSQPVPLRMHSACLTGDLLGSLRCDCGEQLRNGVRRLAAAGGGLLLYLAQEGRGIGLANKLRAYQLQDGGLDTIDADQQLGFTADERSYTVAATMLRHLGIHTVQLLTNSPQKVHALKAAGIDVVDVGHLHGTPNRHNARYIRTKQERAGHFRPNAEGAVS